MISPRSPGSKEGAGLERRALNPSLWHCTQRSLSSSTSLSPFSLVPAPSHPQPLLTTSAQCHSYKDTHRTTNPRHLSPHHAIWFTLLGAQRLAASGGIQELQQDDQERAVARACTRVGSQPLPTGPRHSFQPQCTGQRGPCPMRMRTGFSDFRTGSLGREHF